MKLDDKKRILLFVHDGSGMGHLRRVTRVASELAQKCAILIVTGQRDSLWLIPDNCEFVHVPNWDRLSANRALQNNKPIWLGLTEEDAKRFKSNMFLNIINSFGPDAIIVDYLPLGKNMELEAGLNRSKARKYLINRGVVDTLDQQSIYGESQDYIHLYDRIFFAIDEQISIRYELMKYKEEKSPKIVSTGYIGPHKPDVKSIREFRKITDKNWIVCSAGGGKNAEVFFDHCIRLAQEMPEVVFDIILGPRSKTKVLRKYKNVTVIKETHELSDFIGACDIAIINGGYNSTMEAMAGGADIIVCPNQINGNDEQITNARILGEYYPIKLVPDPKDLHQAVGAYLDKKKNNRNKLSLDIEGAKKIKQIIFNDLEII